MVYLRKDIQLLYVPGWRGELDKDAELTMTRCRVINDYGEHYFRSNIRNGDFLSEISFGIVKERNDYFLVTIEKPSNSILIGNSSFIPTLDHTRTIYLSNLITRNPEAISEIIFSSLVELLKRNGFTRPIETRTFLGRQSKGIISDRKNPITSYSLEWKNTTREFSLCKAEILRVSLFEKKFKFFVSYHPRYEIFEEDFFSPQYSDVKNILMEKWQIHTLMNPEKIISRLKEINQQVLNLKSVNRLVLNMSNSEVGRLKGGKIELPKLKSLSEEEIQFNSTEEFSDILRKSFLKELNMLSKPVLMIIADQSRKPQNVVVINKVKTAFEKLEILFNLIEFDPSKDLNSDFFRIKKPEAVLYLLDKDFEGSNGRYFLFKEITFKLNIPSKVIQYSTFFDKSCEDFFHVISLNLLGIIYRHSKIPIWRLSDAVYDLVIAFSETTRMHGYVKIISLCLSLHNGRKYIGELELRKREDEDLLPLEEIKKELFNLCGDSLEGKKILILTEFDDHSENLDALLKWIEEFKAHVLLIEIFSKDEGRILENAGEDVNLLFAPVPGSFVQVGKTMNSGEYLLITSEVEEEIESGDVLEVDTFHIGNQEQIPRGLPRALRVKIWSNNFQSQYDALKYIFWNTFLHPTSFIRPRKPIDLILTKKSQNLIFQSKLLDIDKQWSPL